MKKMIMLWLIVATLWGCISNDVPYPVIKATFSSFEVEGQSETSTIDEASRTVHVVLDETTDATHVRAAKVEYTSEASSSVDFSQPMDLSRTLSVTLSTYQDYQWRIEAEQPIERIFEIENQVGQSVIDPATHQAVAEARKGTDLSTINITALKLGPRQITVMTPSADAIHDFSSGGCSVEVTYRNTKQTWMLYVTPAQTSAEIKHVDAFSEVAWVTASVDSPQNCGIRYRIKGASEWSELPADKITISGSSLTGRISPLQPQTAYECLVYSSAQDSAVQEFTTEATAQLPDGGFDTWSNAESTRYYSPFASMDSRWWDSGNKGSILAGAVIAQPDAQVKVEGEYSAKLMTKYASVLGIGKLAAGNIFTGEFAGTVGTKGGKVNFGRPFTLRPTRLRGSLKYDCGTINRVEENPLSIALGQSDKGIIYVALGDWPAASYGGTSTSPVQVNTTIPSTLFNPSGPNVIAYGERVLDASTDWIDFEIELQYQSTGHIPTHIIIVCTSSKGGDYFCGSTDSVMWVDNLSLGWD